MKLHNFVIIKLTVALIIGIVLGYQFNSEREGLGIVVVVILIMLITSYVLYKYRKKGDSYTFDAFALLAMTGIGFLNVNIHTEKLDTSHYTHTDFNTNTYTALQVKILERLKPNGYNEKYIVEVLGINSKTASGKLLLNVEKDSLKRTIMVDDTFFISAALHTIPTPKNPFQFDYHHYLEQRHIHHQITTTHNQLLVTNLGNHSSIQGYADQLRTHIISKLKASGFKDDTLAIINALLLGQRHDISAETYANYVNAGTIHILAVSGLHVGIIFIILSFILAPIERLPYGRHYIKPILIVTALWAFASIAGLSPSVTRAVTMFSIIAIAQHLKRPTNTYNTLAISAFILLLIEPRFLLDIGFQMSYIAVFSIVSIQPLLYQLWHPKYLLLDTPWQIFTVTVAAQLGVAPLSLYYFHQFPGLFFVSNVVIIPFLGFILGFGLLVIVLALANILPSFLSQLFSFVIDALNGCIAWVAQFESFLFTDISFNILYLMATYLAIISSVLLYKNQTFNSLRATLVSVIVVLLVLIFTRHKHASNEFVIFNTYKKTLLVKKQGRTAEVFNDSDSSLSKWQQTIIDDYTIGQFISKTLADSLHSVYAIKQKILLVVDSSAVYKVSGFKPDYVLLRQSPKVNLERLITTLQPKQIIADASNYKSSVLRWQATCKTKKIPFHSTYEKGAFIIR